MALKRSIPALVLSLFTTLALSQQQQAILQGGNLPSCAQSCTLLIQASQACSGTTSAGQQAWICFCQSAYLTALRQSAATICPTECTSQSDLAAISSWYNNNCGSDNGASEHAIDGGSSGSSGGNSQASQTAASGAAASSGSSSSSSTDSSGSTNSAPQSWWAGHYQWIIMVIVLAILLPALGVLGHWLKRRHDRNRDRNSSGFNAGITSRVGPMGQPGAGAAGVAGAAEGGANSPARTRDAFMPYGYGYSRSESRLESSQAMRDDRASPLPGAATPDLEKNAAYGEMGASDADTSKRRSKRVLVRERSGADSIGTEKGNRF